jgi:hypothetical protein
MTIGVYEGVPSDGSAPPRDHAAAINRHNSGFINVIIEFVIPAGATLVNVQDERLGPTRAVLVPLGSPVTGGVLTQGAGAFVAVADAQERQGRVVVIG